MKQAYVTVLSDDSYYRGVKALQKSLEATHTKYPLLILITNDVSEAVEKKLGGKNIKRVPSFVVPEYIKKRNQKINQNWNKTFDKLKIFDLIEYDKLVYVLYDGIHKAYCLIGLDNWGGCGFRWDLLQLWAFLR